MEMPTPVTAASTVWGGNHTLPFNSPGGWWLRPGHRAVVVVGLALLEGVGLLLNLAIFTAFIREGAGQASGGALPINLVVADLLTTACVLPLLIRFFHTTTWPFASTGCQVFGFTFQLFGGVSIYTMTAIAIERHYTITHGHQGISKLTRQQGKFVIASWLLSLLVATPPLFGWSSYHMDSETGTCAPNWTNIDGQHASYLFFLAVFGFVLPVAIQAGCYLKLGNTVFSVAKRARASEMSFLQSTVAVISLPMATLAHGTAQNFRGPYENSGGPALSSALSMLLKRQAEFQNLRRLAKLMTWMVLVQIMSWLPYIVSLLAVFFLDGEAYPQALSITMMISTFNIIYNPVMYVYHNRKYRSTVYRCLLPVSSHIRRSCQKEEDTDKDDNEDDPTNKDQEDSPGRQVQNDCPQNTNSPDAPKGSLNNDTGNILLPSKLRPQGLNLYTINEISYPAHLGILSDSSPSSSHLPLSGVGGRQSAIQCPGYRSPRGNTVRTPLGSNIAGTAGGMPGDRVYDDRQ